MSNPTPLDLDAALAEVLELAELQVRGSVLPSRPDRIKLARFAIARIAEMPCERPMVASGVSVPCHLCPPCQARAREET